MTSWTRIITESNWGYCDLYRGFRICDGTHFDLKLNDGTIIPHVAISMEKFSVPHMDMGAPAVLRIERGWFCVTLHGTGVKIRATDVDVRLGPHLC